MTKGTLVGRISDAVSGEEAFDAITALGTVICMMLLAVAEGDREDAIEGLDAAYQGMAGVIKRSTVARHDEAAH